MSRGSFLSRFKNNADELLQAVENKIDLEYDHPDLYKSVYDYYKGRDVYFYHDKDKDYNVILDELEYDLLDSGFIA
tara:strand:- start:31 stop:258 length:228 start_codon:yes stop_codon:yes gene_type:complete